MPSVSKKQQKFMGIVRAIQKGDQPASKFSKDARDAAKKMKKKDVKKFAKTKHDGLPTKVRQEIEEYVDGIIDGIGEQFMVNEEKECMCEACQKGYMTHPTRKTKEMFGKRYRNCIKKEGKVDERKFNHKKVGDHYMGGENTPKGDTEMFADKKGRYYVWVKPKGQKARYIDLPKNVKDRSKADDLHRKIAKTMGESIDEGKYSKIMKAVRKGPKSGPWQIIVSKNNKVVKEVPVKTLQLIPAHYDDIKKAYPNHKIGIEAKDGKIVYREWVVSIKEGSCGYGIDGQLGSEPAGPHLLKKKKKKKDEVSLGGRMAKKIGKHGGTRDKGEIAKILKLLIKRGNKKKDAMDMINKNYDRVSKAYRKASPAKKAEILSSLQESVNEAFRPSDRKVLMVIGRDIIRNLNKTYHKGTLTPSKQLGQALNSIFRAMTRDKGDANYQQYKKYFPKYNDKLLKRLSKAYFDQPYNVQNTFIKKVMDYSLKESVSEGLNSSGYSQLSRSIKALSINIKDLAKAHKKQDDSVLRNEIDNLMFDVKRMVKIIDNKKYNESVNERMDKRQAGEMLKQLGGNKFIAMTGAKNFAVGPKGASFKIGRNSKNVNYVRIDLKNDLYDMEFIQMRAGKLKVKSKVKQIYADQLQQMFTKHTGMYTSL